jgi:hypothetical protein
VKKTRLFFVSALVWELVRFAGLYLLAIGFYKGLWIASGRMAPWLLVFAAGSLILPAGYIMILLNPVRYGVIINLLRFGKGIQIFPVLLVLAKSLAGFASGSTDLGPDSLFYTAVVVVLMDFFYLALLLSYKKIG